MSALIPMAGPTAAALNAVVRQLIAVARLRAASAVNGELSGLYWQVGQRIHREILGCQRTGYGEEIVSTLSRLLTSDYLTVLPSREALQAKLHQSVEKPRLRWLDEKDEE